ISRAMRGRRALAVAAAFGALIALPALGLAHVERASYWPDPAADTAVTPPAGGAVPALTPIRRVLDSSPPGAPRVLCPQPLTDAQKQQLNAFLSPPSGGPTGSGTTTGTGGGGGGGGTLGSSGTGNAPLDSLRSQLEALRQKIKTAHGKKRKKLKKKADQLAQQ